MKPAYWLLKTEPETYSFERLLKEGKTNWNGVRNYQARNNLRKMKKNDLALIYHSGDDKAVVGIAKVIKEAYPDIDADGVEWTQVDVAPIKAIANPVTLKQIKETPSLKEMPLIKQSRLSVMPINENHYEELIKLSAK